MSESTLPHRDAVEAFVDRVEGGEFDAVRRLYLFGSVARGVHRSDSDVDVFAVLADDADVSAVEEQLRDVAYDVMLERGRRSASTRSPNRRSMRARTTRSTAR
ncbi:MAG: nucleotidyltransferase domain-containing protein [Halosimplex sp.]